MTYFTTLFSYHGIGGFNATVWHGHVACGAVVGVHTRRFAKNLKGNEPYTLKCGYSDNMTDAAAAASKQSKTPVDGATKNAIEITLG